MRAVRVGYLQECVFFDDANEDFVASVSDGERSQPSGPKGEVSLYVEGETEATLHTIRQEEIDPLCKDALTSNNNTRTRFSMAPGAVVLFWLPLPGAVAFISPSHVPPEQRLNMRVAPSESVFLQLVSCKLAVICVD
jgi:hypothetical protein